MSKSALYSIGEVQPSQLVNAHASRILSNSVFLILVSLTFVYSQRDYHDLIELEFWLALQILVIIYRLILWWVYTWSESPSSYSRWDTLFVMGSLANIVTWALTVPMFAREDEPATVFLIGMFLVAISAGGVLTVKKDLRLVLAYTLAMMVPYDFWLLLHPSTQYLSLFIMAVLYTLYMTMAGISVHREHLQMLAQNDALQKLLGKYEKSEQYLKTLLQRVPVGIMKYDRNFIIRDCNPAYLKLFGARREEILGMNVLQIRDQRPVETYRQALQGKEGTYEGEYFPTKGHAKRLYIRSRVAPLVDEQGQVNEALATVEDLTDVWEKEQKIRNMAFYDELTGVPNRKLLSERLAQLLALYRRRRQLGALFYLDLDNFKNINDQHGHHMGDKVLLETVRRIRSVLREEDTLARMGGDEFVIVLPGVGQDEQGLLRQVNRVSERIHRALKDPLEIDGITLHTGASIGVVSLDADVSEEELLRRADLAMYKAKEKGRGQTQFYDQGLDERSRKRAALQQDLRSALHRGELELFYQPVLNMNGQFVGAEGLIRWHHKDEGLISPDEFIPLAEEMGLIGDLGYWVLETGCAQLSQWLKDPLFNVQYLSLNVSPRELESGAYVQHLARLLAEYQLPPNALKLEITESVLLKPNSAEVLQLSQIADLGIELLMDDFGTGYSSLEYMTLYPFAGVKIDKVFVQRIQDDVNGHMLVAAMLAIAGQLGLKVIAEGVETHDILQILRSMAPHAHFQGYLASPPVPVEDFERLFSSGGITLPQPEEDNHDYA